MKMTKTEETLLSLMVKSASGIQASGETGRSTWMKGVSAAESSGDMPMRKPSGMATSAASPNPAPTRSAVLGRG